ncbi:MAG TPA: tetratricopeptide repeat protein [Terriglobales bacterium]|nr:tetratricopeptide repeat protein [Terriglobales bacterium]
MSLTSGSKLGPYEIDGPLGSGGMGEVYRARDPRLDRSVAIKLLPSQFSSDPDRLRRFEREARSASALNHPNIVTIYELGQDGSHHFIAMELVEGKTLRELLDAGSLPMRRAIEISAQVAEGLTKAHEAGITHRDLKPENLMITDDGFVKILDFGLAKLSPAHAEQPDADATSAFMTQAGELFGTAAYMSPEQAEGRQADFRSDQFSLGLVLYEMVTGKRAFQKVTTIETLAAILREQFDPVALHSPDAPAPLCWAIERCLAKEPDKRYSSTRNLARELAAIRDHFSERANKPVEVRLVKLPPQRTGFVGREKEVTAAQNLLSQQSVRMLTITGPGGIGKTRLAVRVASDLTESFRGGVYFVPLSALSDSAMIASVIVQTMGIREAGGQSPQQALNEHLQNASQASLLILDNFEQLIEAAPMVAEMLAAGPNLKVLVTSRAALHVYGEHEFPVPPLDLPDPRIKSTLENLSQFPAVALFLQRAVAAKPDFVLTAENASAVSEICARLDGLPLAIELAAARVKVLSPASMLLRLKSRLQLLTGGSRDLPQRQQTLRAAMDWSFDLLSAPEQKLFRRLAVFAGGCDLEGVEAVCDPRGDLELDLLEGMASLIDKSLVQKAALASNDSRFVMLQTIHEYAWEKLEASGEAAATMRAHAAYCLVLAEEGSADQSAAQVAEWLERIAVEHDNMRAALEWMTGKGNADWGLRLGSALFRFWEMREYFAEGEDSLDKLLKLEGAASPTKARARALFASGVLAGEYGNYPRAKSHISESLEISRALHDKQGVAVSLNAQAVQARERGFMEEALSLFENCLELWRELGDSTAIARALSNLANVVNQLGDYTRARSLYAECLSIFRELGDRTGVAWSLNYQGDVARDQGDSAAAQTLYQQALAMFRELDDRWGVAGTLADLGNLASAQRKHTTAHSLYGESIRIFQELQHKRGVARLLECFACSAAEQFQAERSLRLAGTAAALRHNIGSPLSPSEGARIEAALDPPRHALSDTAGSAAWLQGWAMPIESAVEDALRSEAGSFRR